jgi:hypothetical protein
MLFQLVMAQLGWGQSSTPIHSLGRIRSCRLLPYSLGHGDYRLGGESIQSFSGWK